MSSGIKGKNVLLSVDDGSGTMTTIEHQGQATYSSGKSQESVQTKTGSLAYQTESGATIAFTFQKIRPLDAGQNRLYALSDTNDASFFEYNDNATGGHKYAGLARVTIGDETAGVDDLVEVNVTVAFEGEPTRTVNP